MTVESVHIDQALALANIRSNAPYTRVLPVALTNVNIHAQHAGGAAINWTAGFTQFNENQATPSPTRLPRIVLGGGGANPVVYTIYGTSIYDGSAITDVVTATGAGTYSATKPFQTYTRFTSDIDPVGTTDLQTNDTWVHPPARALIVGVAGNVAGRLLDDPADQTLPLPVNENRFRYKLIRITATTATGLLLAW